MLHFTEEDIERNKKFNEEKRKAAVQYFSQNAATLFKKINFPSKDNPYLDKDGVLLPEYTKIVSGLVDDGTLNVNQMNYIYYANQLREKQYSPKTRAMVDDIIENFKKFLNKDESNKFFSHYLTELTVDAKVILHERVEKWLDGKGERPLHTPEAVDIIFFEGSRGIEIKLEKDTEHRQTSCRI